MGRLIQDIKDLIRILTPSQGVIIFVILALIIWFGIKFIFFPVIPAGPQFDCDDSTLAMYHHFKQIGFEVTPIAGNLKMDNEKFEECDHIWLWVNIGGENIAYDWGKPWGDYQHYEGYLVPYEILVKAVKAD